MAGPPDDDNRPERPPELAFLRTLVTVLTATMILGVITVSTLLVIRLNQDAPPVLVQPSAYPLPDGVEMLGYSLVDAHVVIVGNDGRIRVFAADTGNLVQEIVVVP